MTAIFANPRVDRLSEPESLRDWIGETLFSLDDCAKARDVIQSWPGHAPTPLRRLRSLAAATGVAEILYKDESGRFGLGSFKALGGAFAVYTLLADAIEARTGERPTSDHLARGEYSDITGAFTVASATAGNHGRSVAWGARMFGCPAVIYVHQGVGATRIDAIERFGAKVVRVDGDYDESVRVAAADAADRGWTIVSDTSYPGYSDIPRRVMCGYTVLVAEILDELAPARLPTHVLLPAGVGGLAASVAAYLALRLGHDRPHVLVVEPELADCLYQSARLGRPAPASGGLGSFMLGLDCAEVSLVAWEILDRLADDFVLISEAEALASMRQLNQPDLVAGECAGAGLAVLDAAARGADLRASIGLDSTSSVLLIGTEGATDPEAHRRLLSGM